MVPEFDTTLGHFIYLFLCLTFVLFSISFWPSSFLGLGNKCSQCKIYKTQFPGYVGIKNGLEALLSPVLTSTTSCSLPATPMLSKQLFAFLFIFSKLNKSKRFEKPGLFPSVEANSAAAPH